jgi:hypothetical protein
VLLAALAVTAAMAASAVALHHFIASDAAPGSAGAPAPAAVAERLVEEGAAERLTPFFTGKADRIAASAHGVTTIETSAGPAILWASTPASGPICYLVTFAALETEAERLRGKAKCGTRLSAGVPAVFNLHRPVVERRELAIVVGWTHESVDSVVLRSPEGDEVELRLSERFFIAEVPAHRAPEVLREAKPYVVIARDQEGAQLQRWPVAGTPRPLFFNPKVTGPKRTMIETTDSRGRPMRLSLIPIEGGEMCLEIKTRTGTRTPCGVGRVTDRGMAVHPTLMGSMVFLSGSVGPGVATLELHHEDGYIAKLPIVGRFVLHDIPRARFTHGRRPNLLVARDRDGEEVARANVGQTVFAPNSAICSDEDVGP